MLPSGTNSPVKGIPADQTRHQHTVDGAAGRIRGGIGLRMEASARCWSVTRPRQRRARLHSLLLCLRRLCWQPLTRQRGSSGTGCTQPGARVASNTNNIPSESLFVARIGSFQASDFCGDTNFVTFCF
jgi:hypothetical protein